MALRDQLLIPFRGLPRDVAAGSAVLARLLLRAAVAGVQAAATPPAGKDGQDAPGKPPTTGDRLERLGLAALALMLTADVLGTAAVLLAPWAATVLPVLAVAWIIAAGILAPARPQPAAAEGEEEPDEEPARDRPDHLLKWLLQVIGDRPGIHLAELYPLMREIPGQQDHPDPHFRAALRALGIPVQRTLRVGKVAGRSGISRADIEALLSPAESTDVERPVERV
ncbi:hypothetical protein PV392_27595 [Streptomyces sp. ME03-5709C]|nr:hypothetical protein [Streptomyces sp. ME03-5709C]